MLRVRWRVEGGGGRGVLQGRPAIKQKLKVTCTARAEAAPLTGKLD